MFSFLSSPISEITSSVTSTTPVSSDGTFCCGLLSVGRDGDVYVSVPIGSEILETDVSIPSFMVVVIFCGTSSTAPISFNASLSPGSPGSSDLFRDICLALFFPFRCLRVFLRCSSDAEALFKSDLMSFVLTTSLTGLLVSRDGIDRASFSAFLRFSISARIGAKLSNTSSVLLLMPSLSLV